MIWYLRVDIQKARCSDSLKYISQNLLLFIIRYKTGLRLIIDGTYFSRTLCLTLYYDSVHRYPLYFPYSTNEFYKELKEDLQILKFLGVEVASVTCDGKKSIIRAVRKVYERVTLQRSYRACTTKGKEMADT